MHALAAKGERRVSMHDWQTLMQRWNQDLLRCQPIVSALPPEVARSGWLGFPPATSELLRQAEDRLKAILPPSYRDFLLTTNGWRTIGDVVGPLLPVEQVDWLRLRHPETITGWLEGARSQSGSLDVPDEDYFIYGEKQLPETARLEYLAGMLEVSGEAFDGGVFLLNPEIRTPSGEWEAWFLAPWLAGAARYRSFWELMEDEYRQFSC